MASSNANEQAHSEEKEQPQEKNTSLLPAKLEEDDEFEDFPAEEWTEENTELPTGNSHLWEESWDDDNANDDFSEQLKEELKKMEAAKKS